MTNFSKAVFGFCLTILCSILFYACGKTETLKNSPTPPTSGDILKKHSWYPRQYHSVGNDTIFVLLNDAVISQTIVPFDSTHIFENCIQESKYEFLNNDTLLVHDNCETFVALIQHWDINKINQNEFIDLNIMFYGVELHQDQNTLYYFSRLFYKASLDFIDDSKFSITADRITIGDRYGYAQDGELLDSVHKCGFKMTVDFVSK